MPLADNEEVLDLVDATDKVVGTIIRSEAMNPKNLHGNFLRGSNVFIVNTVGELWIPRRTLDKTIAPGGLDYSAGEHVESGEDYLQAAIRGMDEELNIRASQEDLIPLGITTPSATTPPYFNAYFVYHSETAPAYNSADFMDATWLNPLRLLEMLGKGEPAKSSLESGVRLYLDYVRQQRGE